ncbi:PadR family transcriptional regulator [Streptomyces sp. MMBL 11-3]|uniref:PadR family transcriptional regulator n=1 Tax=Streptomyces sp. MMBL 11-3 TaxID=3382639 RepID=UPI0039B3D522
MDINLTPAVVRLIQVFLEDPDNQYYGMQLMRTAHVSSGSLYPALMRLEKVGWIVGELEDIDPSKEGRPARRFYRMTAGGVRAAHVALAELSARVRPPVTSPGWLFNPGPKGT